MALRPRIRIAVVLRLLGNPREGDVKQEPLSSFVFLALAGGDLIQRAAFCEVDEAHHYAERLSLRRSEGTALVFTYDPTAKYPLTTTMYKRGVKQF